MASLQDYLNNSNQPNNASLDALAKNISKYQSNKEVLSTLGQPDPSNPFLGLLSTVGKVLSVPGNLVRGGIAEATGAANNIPQLANQSGLQELMNLASSKTQVGMGDFPIFKTHPGESNLSRFAKLGGALTGDILTDPLSYLGAPASIARKSAGTLLVRHAMNPESTLLNDIVNVSKKGSGLVDELASAAPQDVAANIQKELAVKAEPGTPLDVINNMTKDTLAKQQLGNYLGEGLHAGGRAEVVRRLETLTGDRAAAEQIYKTLPENVKGGVVLTGPLGKPLTDAEGKYIRLTQGMGNFPGAKFLNKARLSLSAGPGAAFNAHFAGKAGEVYSDAVRNIAKENDTLFHKAAGIETNLPEYARPSTRQRLVDYTIAKDAARNKSNNLTDLQGRARGAVSEVLNTGEKFGKDTIEKTNFDKSLENAFFAPQVAHEALTDAQRAGLEAGTKLRAHMSQLFQEARDLGIDIGQIGENYSPLMYTKDTYDEVMKTEAGRVYSEGYNPFAGRDSFVKFFQDPKIADAHGYRLDPENPNIVALDARKVNEVMKQEGDFRRFETDPIKVFMNYANNISGKIATRKFVNELVSKGAAVLDVPIIDKAITRYESALLQDVASKLHPEIAKVAAQNLKAAEKELARLISVKSFKDIKEQIATIRATQLENYKVSAQLEKDAIAKLDIAQEKVDLLYPTAMKSKDILNTYSTLLPKYSQDVEDAQRLARSLRAKVARAEGKPEIQMVQELVQEMQTKSPEIAARYQKILDRFNEGPDSAVNILKNLTMDKERAIEELAAARTMKDRLEKGMPQIMQNDVLDYTKALEERNAALAMRENARDMRRTAKTNADAAKEELNLEGLKTVKTITNDYLDKLNSLSAARNTYNASLKDLVKSNATPEEIKAFKDAELPKLKVLKETVSTSKKVLNSSLDLTSTRLGGIARKYAQSIITASKNLSKEQSKAFEVLSSESSIQKYIDIVANGERNSLEVFQAMGDLNKTFQSIRSLIPDSAYETLSKSEKQFLDEYNYRTITQTARTKQVASPLGMELKATGKVVAAANAATANLYVNSGVKKWLEGIYHIQGNPTSWEKTIQNVLDPLLSIWKSTVTVGRGPGFVATNVAGGLFMNHQGGVSIKQMTQAADVILKLKKITNEVQKEFPNNASTTNTQIATDRLNKELSQIKVGNTDMATVFSEFFRRGAFADTETNLAVKQLEQGGLQTAEAAYNSKGIHPRTYLEEPSSKAEAKFRQAVDFAMTNKAQVFLNDMNQSAEMFMRLGAFISGVTEYKDFAAAMDKVHLLHFDYQDLSHAEEWVRRLAPFYTWSRNNIPAQMRSMFMQPGKIQRAMYANKEFQNTFGADGNDAWLNQVLPEYMNTSDGFLSKFKFGNNNLGFFSKMPYEDLNKFFEVNPNGRPGIRTNALPGLLGPIGTPIQMATGTNFSTGQALSQDVAVPDIYRLLGFIPGTNIHTVPGGGTTMGGAANLGVQNLLPFLGVGQKALSAANAVTGGVTPKIVKDALLSPNQQDAGISSLLSTTGLINLVGLQATTATPKSISGNLYAKDKVQIAAINKFANNAGIDTAWIRKQLANGNTPQDVAIAIQSGQGKKKAVTGTGISAKQAQNYTNAINSLNSPA